MVVDDKLLEVLVCPETHAKLDRADAALLGALNAEIRKGTVRTRSGKSVSAAIEAALVTADKRRVYPVVDGIPVLLVEEAIEL